MIVRQTQNQMRRVRRKLHAADPRCHWCRVVTLINVPDRDPNQATVDHIKPRRECQTQEGYEAASNHVLACFECNQQRDRVDIRMLAHQKEQQARVDRLKATTRRVLVRTARA